jgi:hypothetical protein
MAGGKRTQYCISAKRTSYTCCTRFQYHLAEEFSLQTDLAMPPGPVPNTIRQGQCIQNQPGRAGEKAVDRPHAVVVHQHQAIQLVLTRSMGLLCRVQADTKPW